MLNLPGAASRDPRESVQVMGNLQITATALPDEAGFDQLQGVSGNTLIANNNAMLAFNFYALKYIGSGITLFQNPALTSFEAPRLLAIASDSGSDISTGLQVHVPFFSGRFHGLMLPPRLMHDWDPASDPPMDAHCACHIP